MSTAALLLPDFLLIACGFVLCRYTALDRRLWDGVERLVYYLLFPVLLYTSILKSPLQPAQTLGLAGAGVGTVLCGIGLAYAVKALPRVDPKLHAAGVQVAFRFNSYIALALAERLAGARGLAWMALLIALCVPLCNIAAVWPLARHGGHAYGRELLRNPLIIATVAGLLANLAGLGLPAPVEISLQRMGSAALPLGLMAVGAGLALGGLRVAPGLAAMLLALRHVALPLVAIGLASAFGLASDQRQVVVAFGALPTSAAAYVLAARLGGNAAYVAGLVTVSTVLAMLTLPLWLAWAARG